MLDGQIGCSSSTFLEKHAPESTLHSDNVSIGVKFNVLSFAQYCFGVTFLRKKIDTT